MDYNSQHRWDRAWKMEQRDSWRVYPVKFSFVVGQLAQHANELLLETGQPAALKVLDVACGVGILLDRIHVEIPATALYGCDFSEVALSLLPEYVTGKKEILPNLTYEDDSFDCVVGTEILEHLDNPRKLIEEMFRVCKPGGKVIVSVPNDILGPEQEPEHKVQYNEDSFKALFKGLVQELQLAVVPENYVYAPSFLVAITTKPSNEIVPAKKNTGTVFIAVPSYPGKMRVETCKFLLLQALQGNLKHDPFFESRPWNSCRNMIVKHFLENRQEEFLFMVDSDVVPPGNVLDLTKEDLDVCMALCFSFQEGAPFALALKAISGGYQQLKEIPGNSVLDVDACGAGALLIRRNVLEKIPPPWFEFEYDKYGVLSKGEDFNFCDKAKKAGFQVWVSTKHLCSHYSEIDLLQVNNLLVKTQQGAAIQGGKDVVQRILGLVRGGKSLDDLIPMLENSLQGTEA